MTMVNVVNLSVMVDVGKRLMMMMTMMMMMMMMILHFMVTEQYVDLINRGVYNVYIHKYIYIYLSVCVWVYRGLHCDFGTSPIFSKKYGAVPCCTSSKLKALLPSLRCSPSTLQHQDLSINNQIGDQHL